MKEKKSFVALEKVPLKLFGQKIKKKFHKKVKERAERTDRIDSYGQFVREDALTTLCVSMGSQAVKKIM
uniref:Uncharacterized protein n=1 Tax=Caenorhabditis japonica TaxID=281687 RepID=A0A8R1IE43_CAEJA